MTLTEEEKNYEKKVARSILASVQKITTGEAGKTGAWRSVRPLITVKDCTNVKMNKHLCDLCWLYCPDATVSRTIPPVVDFEYCKGCGICAHECPVKAIKMVPEKEGPSCSDEAAKAAHNISAEP